MEIGSTYLHVWLVYNHPMDKEKPHQTNQNPPNKLFSKGTTINSLWLQIMPKFCWWRNRLDDGERMKGKLDYLSLAVLSWSCGAVHRPRMICRANTWLVPSRRGKQKSSPFPGQKSFETSLYAQILHKRIVQKKIDGELLESIERKD
jgi:hypothetical protein